MNIKERFFFVPFEVISSSSTEYGFDFNELNKAEEKNEKNWQSSKLSEYPIVILLRLLY